MAPKALAVSLLILRQFVFSLFLKNLALTHQIALFHYDFWHP
uniref:Uncharacterized protein n=1 Tax=Anguilla anguilla TaxID=7936 RepID=A0A0E9PEI8_ANGAN